MADVGDEITYLGPKVGVVECWDEISRWKFDQAENLPWMLGCTFTTLIYFNFETMRISQ